MKFLIPLLFFSSFSLANTPKEAYIVAYEWDISKLKLCATNAYCSDNYSSNGRQFIVDGSEVILEIKPWVITFLINKTDEKQYEIKGKVTDRENNSVSNFKSVGKFYFDHSLQFNVGKNIIKGNVFVGKKV